LEKGKIKLQNVDFAGKEKRLKDFIKKTQEGFSP